MSDSKLISVIIPVYNVSEYLSECLDSVMAQTYDNLEIILVDDGSEDGSGDICDFYAGKDARIRVIHQQNAGQSVARNVALEVCKGDLIAFIDSDDVVHPRYFEILYSNMRECAAEVSVVSFLSFVSSDELPTNISKREKSEYTGFQALEDMLYQCKLDSGVWGKIFDKSLFSNLRFKEKIYYEDLELLSRLYPEVDKVIVEYTPLYFYRQRQSSTMHKFTLKRADVLDVADDIEQRVEQSYPALIRAAKDRRFSANMNILWLLTASSMSSAELEDRCWTNIKALRGQELFNSKVRLKNKLGALMTYFGLGISRLVFKIFKPKL